MQRPTTVGEKDLSACGSVHPGMPGVSNDVEEPREVVRPRKARRAATKGTLPNTPLGECNLDFQAAPKVAPTGDANLVPLAHIFSGGHGMALSTTK